MVMNAKRLLAIMFRNDIVDDARADAISATLKIHLCNVKKSHRRRWIVDDIVTCGSSLKSQVVLLQTAHSWANAGVLLGARMHRERVAFETIKVSG